MERSSSSQTTHTSGSGPPPYSTAQVAQQTGIPAPTVAKLMGQLGRAGLLSSQRGVAGEAPYAWFVSFAPAGDADVAVAVMIEEAPGQEIAGGRLGGPIAKAVMEAVLDR